jgi:hypothetical protein
MKSKFEWHKSKNTETPIMILIDNKLISDEVIQNKFVCNLAACKGECCVAGDAGAPLEKDEVKILEEDLENIKPFLTEEGIKALNKQGAWVKDKTDKDYKTKTPLMKGGPCAYTVFSKNGIAGCGIEKAFEAGATTFRKPISCHLYPIRITKSKDMEYLNYDEWEVCNPACVNGAKLKVPVYKFLKPALIRKYGQEFYDTLEATVTHMKAKK